MWQGISKYVSLDMEHEVAEKIFKRLPKLLLAAKTEEAVVRLLAAQDRLNRTRNFDWEDICFRKQVFKTRDLVSFNEEAYEALPSSYQNDDVLEFFFKNKDLYARPSPSQILALGHWESRYDHINKVWEGVSHEN